MMGVRPADTSCFRIALKGGLAQQMLAFKGDVAAHGLEKAAQHVAGRLDVDLGPACAQRVQRLGQLLGETLVLAMLEPQPVSVVSISSRSASRLAIIGKTTSSSNGERRGSSGPSARAA
jgi:hypothetical protein